MLIFDDLKIDDPYLSINNSSKKYTEQTYVKHIYNVNNVEKKYYKVLSYISGIQRALNAVGIPFCEKTFNFSGGFATLLNRLFYYDFDIPHEKLFQYFTDIDVYIPKSTFESILSPGFILNGVLNKTLTFKKNCVVEFYAEIEYFDLVLERNITDHRKIQLINMFDKSMSQVCDSFDLSICKNWFNIKSTPNSGNTLYAGYGPYSWQNNSIELNCDVRNLEVNNNKNFIFTDSINDPERTNSRIQKYSKRYNLIPDVNVQVSKIPSPPVTKQDIPNSELYSSIKFPTPPYIPLQYTSFVNHTTQSNNINNDLNDGEYCDSCTDKYRLKWIDLTYMCPNCRKQFG